MNNNDFLDVNVDSQLPEVAVQLAREAEAAGAPGETGGDQMVEISVRRCRQFQLPEAEIVPFFSGVQLHSNHTI